MFQAVEYHDDVVIRHHHHELPAVSPSGIDDRPIALVLGDPPLVTVAVAGAVFLRIQVRNGWCYRPADPIGGNDLLAFPNASAEEEVADPCQIVRRKVEPTLGVHFAIGCRLPVVLRDPYRIEKPFFSPPVHPLPGRDADDLAEEDADAAVVIEDRPRVFPHRSIENESDPLVTGLELDAAVGRIVVRDHLVPVDPTSHREHVLEGHGRLARVRQVRLIGFEEGHRRHVDARDQAFVHRDAQGDRGDALGYRLEGVEPAAAVVGVPLGMIVVVLVIGRIVLGRNRHIVPFEVVVRNLLSISNQKEMIHQAVAPVLNVGDERVDGFPIDAFGLRGGNGPFHAGPRDPGDFWNHFLRSTSEQPDRKDHIQHNSHRSDLLDFHPSTPLLTSSALRMIRLERTRS